MDTFKVSNLLKLQVHNNNIHIVCRCMMEVLKLIEYLPYKRKRVKRIRKR